MAPVVVLPDTVESAPSPGWVEGAGPVLLIAGATPREAFVVFPERSDTLATDATFDPASVAGRRATLFARAGRLGEATLGRRFATGSSECPEWPRVELTGTGGARAVGPWSVAFVDGSVEAVPADSIGALPGGDSLRLATEIVRLAGTLEDAAGTPFAGLPFAIRAAHRFPIGDGRQGVIADVVRRISLEADPREEHTLLIAERDTSDAPGRYRLAYHERTAGPEESVVSSGPLAIVALGEERRLTAVLIREDLNGVAYSLLQRADDGTWHVRWTSAYAGC